MGAEDSLKRGDLEDALKQLEDQVRRDPSDPKLRVFLFQLLSVMGSWERALKQLGVSGELDPETMPMVQSYEALIRCEALRAEVFRAERTPLFFGEPEEWMAFLLSALKLLGEGKIDQAERVRAQAFEQAPATKGAIDGQPFAWIADADTRIGPMLEAVVNGRYQWIPFHRLSRIRMEPPVDLRDMVWTAASLVFSTGAEVVAFIPTRYAGTEASKDGGLRLARRTEWRELGPSTFAGLGQRTLSTDIGDHPLLDVREIAFG
jgi:type VI secretion system protein ImpE